MPVKVVTQPDVLTTTTFTFVVPGNETWSVRTVYAVATTGVGGTPFRAYQLQVVTSAGPVAIAGAPNAGGDSANDEITWANSPAASVTGTALGIVVASFAVPSLPPGYELTGNIVNAQPGDQWLSATVWLDYAPYIP